MFTVLIGNADAHSKNLALLHTSPGVVELALLYDTVPTALWDKLPDRAAMHINDTATLSDVRLADVTAEARRWSLSESVATSTTESATHDVATHLDLVDDQMAAMITDRIETFRSG